MQQETFKNLKESLQVWGLYKEEENCLYLTTNSSMQDPKLLNLAKKYKIKIQLTFFV